jgi:hypothetical protein
MFKVLTICFALQTLQQVVCLPLRLAQHRRLTMTGSSRRAAKEQSQHHKQLASYSAYKRRVGADLSGSAARVAISASCCATRCFREEQCGLTRCDTCRFLLLKRLAGIAQIPQSKRATLKPPSVCSRYCSSLELPLKTQHQAGARAVAYLVNNHPELSIAHTVS